MATVTPKVLVEGTLLPTAALGDPGLYKSAPATQTTIRSMTMTNVSASVAVVTVHLVKAGDVEADKNVVGLKVQSIQPGTSLIDDTSRQLEAGDFISAYSATANAIAFRADGATVS